MKSQFSSLEEAIKQNSNYYMFLKKNIFTFLVLNKHLSEMTGVFSITAKVKDCSTVWGNSDIKETRLNYVKIL